MAAIAAIVPVMQGLDKDISKIRQAHLAKKSVKKGDNAAGDKAASVSGVAWRKIANDVFRVPEFAVFLAVLVGIGCQIFMVLFTMLMFSLLFFSNQYLRPYVLVASVFYLALMGYVNGFATGRALKYLKLTDWLESAALAAIVFPCWICGSFFAIDCVEWVAGSSSAIPLTRAFYYCAVWAAVTVSLSFLGAYHAFLMPQRKPVTRVNPVARRVPAQPCSLSPCFNIPVSGAIIFATIFIEFNYVMESVWSSYMYAMFGFLYVNLFVMILVVVCLAVRTTFGLVQHGNWNWAWHTFWMGGSVGLYIGAYSLYYMVWHLNVNFLGSEIVYLLYMYVATCAFSVMCGTISLLSGFFFLEFLYSNVKKYD